MPILNFPNKQSVSTRTHKHGPVEKVEPRAPSWPERAVIARLNLVSIGLDFSGTRCQLLYWGLNPDNCNDTGPHAHSFFEACYVFKGRGAVRIDGRSHRLGKGQIFLIRPDQVHRITSGRHDPMGIFFWAFSLAQEKSIPRDDAALERLVDRFGRSRRSVFNNAEEIGRSLDMLSDEATQRPVAHYAVVRAMTRTLILQTLRAFGRVRPAQPEGDRISIGSSRADSSRGSSKKAHNKGRRVMHDLSDSNLDSTLGQPAGPVARARLFLHDNFMRPITVPQVAEHVHLGERQLARLFLKDQSVSVARYLQNLRIEAAGRMLLEERLSIKAIGRRVGYPDVAYFTALFRRSTGLTPGEYRKARGKVYPLRAHRQRKPSRTKRDKTNSEN